MLQADFDPIHSGHIRYLEEAKKLGNILVVGANSDGWLQRKKGREFMPFSERATILQSLHMVDFVIGFDDSDGSAKDAIKRTREMFPKFKIVFANGGDRTIDNIPEMSTDDPNIEFKFGVGGEDKANSSSWILKKWNQPEKTDRQWGYYTVLHECEHHTKVKELVVEPGKSLSMQRHSGRNELWFVSKGIASVFTLDEDGNEKLAGNFGQHDGLRIPVNVWHRLQNGGPDPLHIVEIQFGPQCVEEDIERKIA